MVVDFYDKESEEICQLGLVDLLEFGADYIYVEDFMGNSRHLSTKNWEVEGAYCQHKPKYEYNKWEKNQDKFFGPREEL